MSETSLNIHQPRSDEDRWMKRSLLYFIIFGTMANAGSVLSYHSKGATGMAAFEGFFLVIGLVLIAVAASARESRRIARLTAALFIAHNSLFFVVTAGANSAEVLLHFTVFPTLFIYYLGVREGLIWSVAALLAVAAPLAAYEFLPGLPRLLEFEGHRELVLASIVFLYLVQMGFNALFQRFRLRRIGELELLLGHLERQLETQKRLQREKEDLHEQVVRSSKLAAIGELAAGVTHEVNNPLMVAMLQRQLAEERLGKLQVRDNSIQTSFRLQRIALERIKAIVSGLRTFARGDAPVPEAFDAHFAIQECFALLEGIFERSGIRFEPELEAEGHWILGNVGRFNQVIVNLLGNARDAVLERRQKGADPGFAPRIRIRTSSANGVIRIEVTDNGCGIPEANLRKIFDAFFTTKAAGKGTGLGLSLSSSIVGEMKGRMDVSSRPDDGATFVVEVPLCAPPIEAAAPAAEPPATAAPAARASASPSAHGLREGFRALILDDEEELAMLLRMRFETWGIACDAVTDHREAFQLARGSDYDVIITDMQMAGITVPDLLGTLAREARGNPPMILMTGNAANVTGIDGLPVIRIFEKPFEYEALLELLRSRFRAVPASASTEH